MSKGTKFCLVSLPSSIVPSSHHEEALNAIKKAVTDNGTVQPFPIPAFKIGTLDSLIQQADDLAKLESSCEQVVNKVGDSLQSLLEGNEEKIAQQKTINDKPVDQYLRSFQWNKVKYRADKSVAELMESLQKELTGIDNDVKTKFSQHNQVKTSLATAQRRQTGNLSTKSLAAVVPPETWKYNSEFLDTHLIAVPKQLTKDFIKSYETLAEMVVPRSATDIATDDEFTLYSVLTFHKHSADFVHKCREKRWTPRDYKHKEGDREIERKETAQLSDQERKVWGEALRLGRTGYSDGAMIWIHVLALRVFVETVLRYGLPLDFVCALVQTTSKASKKVRGALDNQYSYLGGNAFGRDNKGRIKKDDAALSNEMHAAGHGDGVDYTAYVYYEFAIV